MGRRKSRAAKRIRRTQMQSKKNRTGRPQKKQSAGSKKFVPRLETGAKTVHDDVVRPHAEQLMSYLRARANRLMVEQGSDHTWHMAALFVEYGTDVSRGHIVAGYRTATSEQFLPLFSHGSDFDDELLGLLGTIKAEYVSEKVEAPCILLVSVTNGAGGSFVPVFVSEREMAPGGFRVWRALFGNDFQSHVAQTVFQTQNFRASVGSVVSPVMVKIRESVDKGLVKKNLDADVVVVVATWNETGFVSVQYGAMTGDNRFVDGFLTRQRVQHFQRWCRDITDELRGYHMLNGFVNVAVVSAPGDEGMRLIIDDNANGVLDLKTVTDGLRR